MPAKMIRYRAKADRAQENQDLIAAVFQELAEARPPGVHYTSVRLDDDTFVHTVELEGATNPLEALGAFQRFQSDIASRCAEPPTAVEAVVIGRYSPDPR